MAQSISTGAKTEQVLDPDPQFYGFRVDWIEWDSPFRDTDLQIGDLVQGVDGVHYPSTPSWLAPLDDYLTELNRLTVSPEAYKQRLDRSFRSEGTLVMLFGKTCVDVKRFLEEINLEAVEDQVKDTKKASLDKVSGWIPPGLNDDGKAFVEDCAKELSRLAEPRISVARQHLGAKKTRSRACARARPNGSPGHVEAAYGSGEAG